ncbi:MAG: DUF4129 domain-containing protein [Acidimicrobiales bacterium]|nr:DUF4129 domain-containing protein [Acidimicrobiales bacterium]
MIDPDEARREADDILSDAAYAEPTRSLLDRAVDWLFDRLGDAFDAIPGGGPGTGIAWVFVVALVALAAYFLLRALRAPRIAAPDEDDGLRYGTETSRDATVWMAEASRLAAAGEHRGALRCRHQALVAVLVTEAVVADVAGRTAGEYASAAGSAMPTQADRLRSVTDDFDGAWYGGRSVGADDYRSFSDACALVETAATTVPA